MAQNATMQNAKSEVGFSMTGLALAGKGTKRTAANRSRLQNAKGPDRHISSENMTNEHRFATLLLTNQPITSHDGTPMKRWLNRHCASKPER